MPVGPDQAFTDTVRLFRMLASAVPVGLAFIDLELRYLVVNEAFAGFVERAIEQIVGQSLSESVPTLWPQIEPFVRRAMLKGEGTYDCELTRRLPGGDTRRWSTSYVPLRNAGQIVGVGIAVLDGGVFDAAPDVVSRQSEEIQYSLDIDDYHPDSSSDRVLDMLGIQRHGVSADGPKPDADHWVHERSELQVGASGQQTLVGTVRHITGRSESDTRLHQMQAELLHVSRLSAIGQVSSTLAHEVNQPLTAIGNYIRASLLMLSATEPVPNAKIRAVLEKAASQTARASEIVRNLREFARKGDIVRRAENLTVVIQEAMALARLGVKDRGLKVRLRLAGDSHWAIINRVQIQQVLVNLIRNAIEAMGEGARRELIVATSSGGRELIEVSVTDTGPGLSETVARDLFKPFVTTKSEGMGVGLAICQTIVGAHGGTIWAEANPAGGTVFRFTVRRAVGDDSSG